MYEGEAAAPLLDTLRSFYLNNVGPVCVDCMHGGVLLDSWFGSSACLLVAVVPTTSGLSQLTPAHHKEHHKDIVIRLRTKPSHPRESPPPKPESQ